MRSTTKMLNELNNNNNDDVRITLEKEVEPLLDDSYRLDIFEDDKFEVVVDVECIRTGISDIPSHDSLLGEINRVIEILEPAIENAKSSNANKYYLRAALCIGGGLLVLTAPTLFTSLMWSQILRSTESMVSGLVAEIVKYKTLLSQCKSAENAEWVALRANAAKLHEIIKPAIEKWYKTSGDGENCAGWNVNEESGYIENMINHPHEFEFDAGYWCRNAKDLGEYGDSDVCLAAAKNGCELMTQHAEEATAILNQYHKFTDITKQCSALEHTVSQLENEDIPLGFIDRIDLTNALIAGGLAVGAAVVVGLLIWAHHRAKNNRRDNDINADKYINLLGNAEDAATVINLFKRLNIPFGPERHAFEVLADLKAQKLLMDQRTALFDGAKDPNSSICAFFNNPASKDVKRMLIKEAGLGASKFDL